MLQRCRAIVLAMWRVWEGANALCGERERLVANGGVSCLVPSPLPVAIPLVCFAVASPFLQRKSYWCCPMCCQLPVLPCSQVACQGVGEALAVPCKQRQMLLQFVNMLMVIRSVGFT